VAAPAADDEERATGDGGRGSRVPERPDCGIGGASAETIERTSLRMPATLRRPAPELLAFSARAEFLVATAPKG
jgi:hypothetical protein